MVAVTGPLLAWLAVMASALASQVSAKTLKPIRPIADELHKRDPLTTLELRNADYFVWADNETVAAFEVEMPNDYENILSMERFDDMLVSTQCTQSSITLGFRDSVTLDHAERVWDWVNGDDNHTFVMVVGAGQCNWNENRTPFVVANIAYDRVEHKAYLNASAAEWSDVVHTYDLQFGTFDDDDLTADEVDDESDEIASVPFRNTSLGTRRLARRFSLKKLVNQAVKTVKATAKDVGDAIVDLTTINQGWGMNADLNYGYPFSVKLSEPSGTKNPMAIQFDCTDKCKSTGQLKFSGRFSGNVAGIKEASFQVVPSSWTNTFDGKLTFTGSLVTPTEWKKEFGKIPLGGFNIPGIANLGPAITFLAGVKLSPADFMVSIGAGAKFSFPDNSVLKFDLANPSAISFSGWVPSIDPIPLSVTQKLQTKIETYFESSLGLDMSVLSAGFAAKFAVRAPNLEATFSVNDSPTGNACSGRSNVFLGVEEVLKIGVKFLFEAGSKTSNKLQISFPIFDILPKELGRWCQALVTM